MKKTGSLNGMNSFVRRVVNSEADMLETFVGIVTDVVTEGAALQREKIDAAETITGVKRMAEGTGGPGATAGRHDEGDMIGDVGHTVEVNGNIIRGSFGFTDPEAYFLIQDGLIPSDRIPAANSLTDAEAEMTPVFRQRIFDAESRI